jgi:hypothetical protein
VIFGTDRHAGPLRTRPARAVQFDYEKAAKQRPVRLAAPTAVAGDPVRIGISGVEVEGRIVDADGTVLRVRLKATPLTMGTVKRTRRA